MHNFNKPDVCTKGSSRRQLSHLSQGNTESEVRSERLDNTILLTTSLITIVRDVIGIVSQKELRGRKWYRRGVSLANRRLEPNRRLIEGKDGKEEGREGGREEEVRIIAPRSRK